MYKDATRLPEREHGLEERKLELFEASYERSGQIGPRREPDQKSGQMLTEGAKVS